MKQRVPIADDEFMKAYKLLMDGLQRRIREKGRDCLISLHEIDGGLDEEVREFKGEVHADDRVSAMNELIDIGVHSLLGIASISTAIQVESDAAKAAAKVPPAKS